MKKINILNSIRLVWLVVFKTCKCALCRFVRFFLLFIYLFYTRQKSLLLLCCIAFSICIVQFGFAKSILRIQNGTDVELTYGWNKVEKALAPYDDTWEWLNGAGDKIHLYDAEPRYSASDTVIPVEITATDSHRSCGSRAWWVDYTMDGQPAGSICSFLSGDLNSHSRVAFCDFGSPFADVGRKQRIGFFTSCIGSDCDYVSYATCPYILRSPMQAMGSGVFGDRYFHAILPKALYFQVADAGNMTFRGHFVDQGMSWEKNLPDHPFTAYSLSKEVYFIIHSNSTNMDMPVDVKTTGVGAYGRPCISLNNNKTLLHFGIYDTSAYLYNTFCSKNENVPTHWRGDAQPLYLFFADGTYATIRNNKVNSDGIGTYKGWSIEEGKLIVAAVHWSNQKVFFLVKKGEGFHPDPGFITYHIHPEFIRKILCNEQVLDKSTIDQFGGEPGSFNKYIDKITAAVTFPQFSSVYYFLTDGTYIRQSYITGNIDRGPIPVSQGWGGISDTEAKEITAAVNMHNGYIWFFLKGKKYIKYDIHRDEVATDHTYPQPLPYSLHADPIAALLWVW